MNEKLVEFLVREIVSELPEKKKLLYKFIVAMEDRIAEQADSAEQFMELLIIHAPHEAAARHFHISYGQLIKIMFEIEEEIDQKLQKKYEKIKWIDYTKKVRGLLGEDNDNKHFFLFLK